MSGRRAAFARVSRQSGALWACALALDEILPLGAVRLWPDRVVPASLLAAQLEAILRAWGMAEDHVAKAAEKILWADLRGIDSHGCSMLPFYDRLRAEGRLNPRPRIALLRETETTALVDGGGGLGHVPAMFAMERAIEKCRTSGVAVSCVTNSGHYGAAGAYAAMAAEHGLIGVATTSTPAPSVVPTFAKEARLGTNPIAFAAPAASARPFLLDMATSTASLGKLVERWRRGRRIPGGWAVDASGGDVRNGRAAARGRRLTPLGGDPDHGSHKGYGLAVMVEILSAVLPGRSGGVGHFMLALDPARFRATSEFAADVEGLLGSLRDTPPVEPDRPVQVAGDPEREILARRIALGIPLARTVFEDIRSVAAATEAPFLLEAPPT